MSDLKRYVQKRKNIDKRFAKKYDEGYAEFKVGVVLRNLREEAGLTQGELANALHTHKSAISRIETKSEDIRLSTLFKIAEVFGKHVSINIV
jgi:HTH-type transcriptional regulator / antitoxin HipB